MKSFEYSSPSNLKQAAGLLSDTWGETEVLAGGTDLVTSLKQQITTPKRVVSLRKISDLQRIRATRDSVRIGATATLHDVANHNAVKEHFPAIVTAIRNIGSPQIINVGTAGGDLCQRPRCWYFRNGYGLLAMKDGKSLVVDGQNRYHAIFGNEGPAYFVSASSLGPVLVALGATIKATGPSGKTREIPAAEFFHTPKNENEREVSLEPNEIVTEIEVPILGLRNGIYEVRHRHGLDWPYVAAAVAFQDEGGKANDARVVLGHVAPTPWPASKAAEALNGITINADAAAKAGRAAADGARPLSDNGYKVQLVQAAVKRAVLAAAERI